MDYDLRCILNPVTVLNRMRARALVVVSRLLYGWYSMKRIVHWARNPIHTIIHLVLFIIIIIVECQYTLLYGSMHSIFQ